MSSTDILKIKTKRKLLGVLIFFSVIIYFHRHFLIIKEVTCQAGSSACPDGVISLLDRVRGRSILRLNKKDLQEQVLSTGLVDQVEFTVKLPGKLIVTGEPPAFRFLVKTAYSKIIPDLTFLTSSTSALPSTELANYVASMSGETFQLLSTGVLNQTDGDSNYFLISQSISGKNYLAKVFVWLRSLALSSMKPNAIYFLSDMIILRQDDQPDLIMNFSADPEGIILALQRLNQVITIKKPTVIDFRYSRPILK